LVKNKFFIFTLILIALIFVGCAPSEEVGIVLEGFDLPDSILRVAKDRTQLLFDKAVEDFPNHGYVNWRIVSLEHSNDYEDFWDKDFVVYQMVYEFLSETPENIVLNGRMSITDDNWVMPSYRAYLIFEKKDDSISFLGNVITNDYISSKEDYLTKYIRKMLDGPSEFDKEIKSIKETISNQKGINDKINIFDIVEIEGYRIVGFYEGDPNLDGNIGYALYKTNRKGEYEIDYVNTLGSAFSGDRTYVDEVTLYNSDKSKASYYIVITNNPFINRIERILDNESKEILYITDIPSINLMRIPEFEFSSSTFFYYDENGNDVTGKSIQEIINNQ